MKGPRQPLFLFLKAEVSVSQSAGKEDSPRTTSSFGFHGDTKMKEQERRHSLNSSLHFSPLYCKVSMESRDIRDAVRARLYRHLVLLDRKTKVPIPPPSPTKPNQLLMVFAAGNWPQVSLQTLQALAILTRVQDPPQIKGSA